jgi:hypothetical protein
MIVLALALDASQHLGWACDKPMVKGLETGRFTPTITFYKQPADCEQDHSRGGKEAELLLLPLDSEICDATSFHVEIVAWQNSHTRV